MGRIEVPEVLRPYMNGPTYRLSSLSPSSKKRLQRFFYASLDTGQ